MTNSQYLLFKHSRYQDDESPYERVTTSHEYWDEWLGEMSHPDEVVDVETIESEADLDFAMEALDERIRSLENALVSV